MLLVFVVTFVFFVAVIGTARKCKRFVYCDGELLHNGICLPKEWPPKWSTPTGLPPRDGAIHAPWIKEPPPVINVSSGRQLFVDMFLIDSMSGLQLFNHAARWEHQSMRATEPWETMRTVPKQNWVQGSRKIGYAQPFSGGVWWDDSHQPKPCYRAWYSCGSNLPDTPAKVGGCCYMESEDGLSFVKPAVATGEGNSGPKGTNIVLQEDFDGNVVWLDYEARPDERWKMATVPADLNFSQMHLLTSPDGIHWRSRLNGTGPLADRSTFWRDRFRNKWIFSLKQNYKAPWGRSRGYVEADDFISGANWSQAEIMPWTSSDARDPPWPYNGSLPSELYTLDGTNYESIILGLFSIFRGFVNVNATANESRTSAEHDEIYLGFSRDGFHWYRQSDGNAQAGGATPRRSFMAQSWPVHTYRYSGVQSTGGGLVLGKIRGEERLLFYASVQSGMPFDPKWTGGNSSMGVASLRRDGFTSVEAMMSGSPGVLVTRPLVWNADRRFLFLNVVVQTGGFMQVAVLNAETNETMFGFSGRESMVGPLAPNTCVSNGTFDSTRAPVSWLNGISIGSLGCKAVRLRFEFAAASLYSFWLAKSTCGASDGFVGAGGPGTVSGRDVHGSCV